MNKLFTVKISSFVLAYNYVSLSNIWAFLCAQQLSAAVIAQASYLHWKPEYTSFPAPRTRNILCLAFFTPRLKKQFWTPWENNPYFGEREEGEAAPRAQGHTHTHFVTPVPLLPLPTHLESALGSSGSWWAPQKTSAQRTEQKHKRDGFSLVNVSNTRPRSCFSCGVAVHLYANGMAITIVYTIKYKIKPLHQQCLMRFVQKSSVNAHAC